MIGDRIQLAREACAMTQAELASAAGLSQGTLSDIENGQILNPAPRIVTSISSATGFPVGYFHLGPLPDFPEGSFRRLRRGSSKVTDQVRAQVRQIAEVVQRGERSLSLPPILLKPVLTLENQDAAIEKLALEVRQYLRVGDNDPIPNLTRAVERAGVIVVRMPIAMVDHSGFSVWPDYAVDGRPLIAVSGGESGDRMRFTIAHELGHLILHTARLNIEAKVAEIEAHRFAGAILLPKKAALNWIRVPVTLGTLMPVKARTGASLAMLAKRALDLQIIDQQHFVSLRKQISARGWTKSEPVEVSQEQTVLIGKILDAMSGLGSWADRADRVAMQPFSFRSLVAG